MQLIARCWVTHMFDLITFDYITAHNKQIMKKGRVGLDKVALGWWLIKKCVKCEYVKY